MRSPGHLLPPFFCLFSIALILPSLAHAGINQWTSIGPDATELWDVRAIVVDPTSATTVYVGGLSGVFRTSDGGATWSRTEPAIYALAIDPSTPSTVYAGGCGMWKSIDAGATWMAIDRGLTHLGTYVCIYALAIDPANPAILYAGTSTNGVYKSVNGGANWSEMNSGFPRGAFGSMAWVSKLVVDPLHPSTVYAAAGRVFKSTNGGSTWTAMAELRMPSEFGPHSVDSLILDPSDPDTLYAGNYGAGIFKSTDGAASWQQLSRPAGYPVGYAYPVTALAIDPVSPGTVYATMDYNNPYFGVLRTVDGGETWTFLNVGLPTTGLYLRALAVSPSSPSTLYAGTGGLLSPSGGSLWEFTLLEPCAASATTLCLNDSRFRVEVSWHAANLDTAGPGQAVPLTTDTGHFWFFSSNNIELVVKVVDGRALNNHFWVFYGALSDVEYTITVTETQTGAVKSYFNPQGHLASVADTAAFAATGGGAPPITTGHTSPATAGETVSCSGDPTTLCLNASRFRVQVSWRAVNLGTSGQGQAMSLTADTGYFWFFSSNNLELVIKVVDGRAFNDHFWVFYGALSDVEYTVTVADTETGAVRTYVSPQGRLASVADTAAF